MQEDLTALLLATPAVTGLVGTRVHWGMLPPTVQGRPYLNLTVVSDPQQYHFKGPSQLRQPRVQIDIWAESAASARAVAAAVEALLSGYRGDRGSTRFRGVFLTAARDLTDTTPGRERDLFRRSLEFTVNWIPQE